MCGFNRVRDVSDPDLPGEVPLIMIERAIEIALKVHSGATDKAGVPYILHPLHLMLQMHTPEQQIVAVLHDTVEDSGGAVTLQTLRAEGFQEQIVTAVDALTKRDGESYDLFISRLAPNPLARIVKLADLRHNADLTRIQSPSAKDYERAQKYQRSIEYLESFAVEPRESKAAS
jgi:(p)ppGpp synthase/HD superfamily hydrolase